MFSVVNVCVREVLHLMYTLQFVRTLLGRYLVQEEEGEEVKKKHRHQKMKQ